MRYRTIHGCRICGNTDLLPILHLGEQALTGVFPKTQEEAVETGPLELVKCDEGPGGCGLVQLRHSFVADMMYGDLYGYRSGLNAMMVEHLRRRVHHTMALAQPLAGDVILDIGSNDATTLKAYPPHRFHLLGMDPTGKKFARFYPSHVRLTPDFFSADQFEKECPGRRAKIITSIAMFYDLDNPLDFMRQIHRILDDRGIWVFEQSYLPAMLAANAYDTICHEHLSYYDLKQIQWMTERAGLRILAVEINDVNGGSFCVTVAKQESPFRANPEQVDRLLAEEERRGLRTMRPFEAFADKVRRHRADLRRFMDMVRRNGQSIYGYGASTKGNVILQYCELGPDDLPAIAEVNEDKFGAFTPGTRIPIVSEEEVRRRRPDYVLVLPWHFRTGIIRREAVYLAGGGNLVFPLPSIRQHRSKSARIKAGAVPRPDGELIKAG